MERVLYWIGGVINWLAYIWLVTSETFEEICFAAIGDPLRGIISTAESRKYTPKAEQRRLSHRSTAAKVADTL